MSAMVYLVYLFPHSSACRHQAKGIKPTIFPLQRENIGFDHVALRTKQPQLAPAIITSYSVKLDDLFPASTINLDDFLCHTPI